MERHEGFAILTVVFVGLALLVLTVALSLSGCGLTNSATVAKARPCLDVPVPKRAGIENLVKPEPAPLVDAEGNQTVGFKMIVEPNSMMRFFDYVETLENLAHHAETCLAGLPKPDAGMKTLQAP